MKKLIYSLASTLLVLTLLFSFSCKKEVVETKTVTVTQTVTSVPPTQSEVPETTEKPAVTNWWDKFGKPVYGGEIIFAPARFHISMDAYSQTDYGASLYFLEPLWIPDWKVDRKVWPFAGPFIPQEYLKGQLAESWEIIDSQTMVVKIRQGIHWQNKEPVNGREFTAYDVEFHYDRFLGTGSGFTEPSKVQISRMGVIEKVTAQDKYTVIFKFKKPSALNFAEPMEQDGRNCIEAPEVIKQFGDATNWRNAVGTGPWILTDYVESTSFTFQKNPNYWGYDERHPENKLPYADSFKVLYISDVSTRIAALRTGKVHFADEIGFQQAKTLTGSNPELNQAQLPFINTNGLFVRLDQSPFNDINVRKAMQMAIDRKALAEGYYGGIIESTPCGAIHPSFKGYAYTYDEWPNALKDEYSYNPAKARELLATAGYPKGFTTTVLVSTADDLAVLEAVKSYFNEIGIILNIGARDPVTTNSLAASRKYETFWNRNTGSVALPFQIVTMYQSKHSQNFSMASDPNFDKICDELLSVINIDDVKPLVHQLDKYIIEQHWGIRLFPINTFNIWQPYLKGYSGESLLRMGNPGGWLWARLWLEK